jgi:hypothetical protein
MKTELEKWLDGAFAIIIFALAIIAIGMINSIMGILFNV